VCTVILKRATTLSLTYLNCVKNHYIRTPPKSKEANKHYLSQGLSYIHGNSKENTCNFKYVSRTDTCNFKYVSRTDQVQLFSRRGLHLILQLYQTSFKIYCFSKLKKKHSISWRYCKQWPPKCWIRKTEYQWVQKTNTDKENKIRFQFPTVLKDQIVVFWLIMPCSPVDGYQPFKAICCLHFQGKVKETNSLKGK
jgi:hypothetical protein